MAKKFVGFKPEVMQKKILPSLGYKGAMDQKSINQFLAASPSAAAMMGQLTLAAKRLVEKPVKANTGILTGSQSTGQIQADPTKMVSIAQPVANQGGPATQVSTQAGQAGQAPVAQTTQAQPAAAAQPAPTTPAAQTTTGSTQTAVRVAGTQNQAAQGTVDPNAQMQAAQADPQQASQLGLQAAQLGQAQQVQAPILTN